MTRCPRCEAVDARPSARFCARCGYAMNAVKSIQYSGSKHGYELMTQSGLSAFLPADALRAQQTQAGMNAFVDQQIRDQMGTRQSIAATYNDWMTNAVQQQTTSEPDVRFETERPRNPLLWPVAAYLAYAAIAVSLLIWLYG